TELGLLDDLETTSGGLRSYALVPDRIEACLPADTDEDGTPVLLCDECRETVTGTSDRKSTRLNSSHVSISYAVFCLKKKTKHPMFGGGSPNFRMASTEMVQAAEEVKVVAVSTV